MSYTAIYSPLKSLKRDTSGAVIEDIEAWRDYADRSGIFSTLYQKAVTRQEVIRSDYPGEEYTVLYGFRTWERRDSDETLERSTSTLGCHFNIEQVGYRSDTFNEVFAELSRITEPFYFYQPGVNHGLDEHGENIIENGPVIVAKVWGEDGKVTIEEFEIEARSLHTDTSRGGDDGDE